MNEKENQTSSKKIKVEEARICSITDCCLIHYCKEFCKKHYNINYNLINKQKLSDYHKNWYKENKDLKKSKMKIYHYKNRDIIKEKRKPFRKEINKNAWNNRKNDPIRHLTYNLRTRLNTAIRKNYKAGSAVKDLGCSIQELKSYLESKFQPEMTWENYGEWHIDHIIPLSRIDLTNREEFLKVVHYTNLQPLWAKDNQSKYNKIYE